MRVSEDPILGSDQKEGNFYERFREEYIKDKPSELFTFHTAVSIQNRIKAMSTKLRRFSNAYNSAIDRKPSGAQEDDIVRLATGLYNGKVMKSVNDNPGRPFQFFASWKELRDMPKFNVEKSKEAVQIIDGTNPNSSAGRSEESGTVQQDDKGKVFYRKISTERPKGRKKAKMDMREEAKTDKKLRLAESSLELQRQQIKQMESHNAMMAFTNGPGGAASDEAQEYFALVRSEFLEAARKRKREREEEEKVDADNNQYGLAVLFDVAEEVSHGK